MWPGRWLLDERLAESSDSKYRTRRRADDSLRNAAKQQVARSCESVRRDHDEVVALVRSKLDDVRGGPSLDDVNDVCGATVSTLRVICGGIRSIIRSSWTLR